MNINKTVHKMSRRMEDHFKRLECKMGRRRRQDVGQKKAVGLNHRGLQCHAECWDLLPQLALKIPLHFKMCSSVL